MPSARALQVALGAAAITAGAVLGLYVWRRRNKRKKPARVVFAITGFGKFNGVGENPTERFVKHLPFFIRANPLPAHVVVDRCIVMEVSAEGVKQELDVMRQTVFQNSDDSRVYLHLGVAVKNTDFKIETTAWNEASFRVKDERGWEPSAQPIHPEDGKISAKLRTRLPSGLIIRKLQRLNFPVTVSSDPGRFVCNYLYYESLRLCMSPPTVAPVRNPETSKNDSPPKPDAFISAGNKAINAVKEIYLNLVGAAGLLRQGVQMSDDMHLSEYALFVHCPPTEAIDDERQLAFIHSLLTIIGDTLCK